MYRYFTVTLVVFAILAVGSSVCAQSFPSVTLTTYDPMTGTYVYTVTCPADSTYPFGYLQIDTELANVAPTGPWIIDGPLVDGINKLWPVGCICWDPTNGKYAAVWDPYSRGTVIPALTAWTGEFILVVPESEPVPGKAATKDGQIGSYKIHDVLVPGPKGGSGPSGDPPTTTIELDGTMGLDDWYVSMVTATLTAVDPDNDIALTEYDLDTQGWQLYDSPFDIEEDGLHELLARSEDLEGNLEDPPKSCSFKIDATPPIVFGSAATAPNSFGWYKGDVQINYTVLDEMSGLAAPQAAEPGVIIQFDQTVTGEGANLSDSASATDKAGNEGWGTVSGINIDRTPPTITVTSAPVGNCHLINYETAVVQFTATDSVSAIQGMPWAEVAITPTDGWVAPSTMTLTAALAASGLYEVSFPLQAPGAYTVTLFAKDSADNIGQVSTPVSFGAGGFTVEWLPPISLMDTYLMPDGSTVPVKFRLIDPCNNNAYVNNYQYTLKVVYNDPVNGPVLKALYTPEYDPAIGGYHVNVQTKDENNVRWALGDYTIIIEGPGIWDVVSGPYKAQYGLQIVDNAVAKGVGRR